ncbi:hypothetical protein IU459_11975 [Nocardia amamiensis]|uniref:Uncharacterized protein n=1 Tax=Nocardia amamiensis TaxID=404578 RepID=A0ABS0CTT2_9NOCA|nr:hypothetical protein [Nocardia amamiensis]MBF6298259.1 hypothetical protein [Nocardia amamiensis]
MTAPTSRPPSIAPEFIQRGALRTIRRHTREEAMQEYITTGGKTIRTGQHYRDARATNVRTLRVDHIHEPYNPDRPDDRAIDYTVVLVDGEPPARSRGKSMTAARLTSRNFILIDGAK